MDWFSTQLTGYLLVSGAVFFVTGCFAGYYLLKIGDSLSHGSQKTLSEINRKTGKVQILLDEISVQIRNSETSTNPIAEVGEMLINIQAELEGLSQGVANQLRSESDGHDFSTELKKSVDVILTHIEAQIDSQQSSRAPINSDGVDQHFESLDLAIAKVDRELNSIHNFIKSYETGSEEKKIDDENQNLQKIAGIGRVLEKKLKAHGITSIHLIANWNAKDVREVGALLAFPGRIERECWVLQAQKLINSQMKNERTDKAS